MLTAMGFWFVHIVSLVLYAQSLLKDSPVHTRLQNRLPVSTLCALSYSRGQPRLGGAVPHTLEINLSCLPPASICKIILLNHQKVYRPIAGAGRPFSQVALLEEFVSSTMLKWRMFNANVVRTQVRTRHAMQLKGTYDR